MMSALYSVQMENLKCQEGSESDSSIISKSPASSPSKTKNISMQTATAVASSHFESKPVLGQISMNHQQKEPSAKKRRVSDGSSTKVRPPPAVAVARRNARERNRVKQVNNGFSMLRDHIPPEIADTFEQAGRGNAKKLSKVETLRMAVEYIRSLEKMLSFESSNDSDSSSPLYMNSSTFSNMSAMSETSLPATPPPETQQPFFYALKPHGGVMETQITIIGGQQYLRIPNTNTFQLVTPESYENEENVHPNNEFTSIQIHPPTSPLMIQPAMNNLMSQTPSLNFVNEINSNTSVINSTKASETPAGSISPYSGHSSLSPAPSHHADNINNNVIMEDGQYTAIITSARHEPNDEEANEFKQSLPFADQLMIQCGNADTSHYDNLILKQEIIDDDGMFDENSLSNEHMIDAMQWWEQQQNLNQTVSP